MVEGMKTDLSTYFGIATDVAPITDSSWFSGCGCGGGPGASRASTVGYRLSLARRDPAGARGDAARWGTAYNAAWSRIETAARANGITDLREIRARWHTARDRLIRFIAEGETIDLQNLIDNPLTGTTKALIGFETTPATTSMVVNPFTWYARTTSGAFTYNLQGTAPGRAAVSPAFMLPRDGPLLPASLSGAELVARLAFRGNLGP
jgi:hypothetical protein